MGMGHWEWGMGNWAWGMGHWKLMWDLGLKFGDWWQLLPCAWRTRSACVSGLSQF